MNVTTNIAYPNQYINGYGTDSSGFVSICWELPSQYTTLTFRDNANAAGGYVDSLGSYGQCGYVSLRVGDACNSLGHIILFASYHAQGGINSMEETLDNAQRRYWSWSGWISLGAPSAGIAGDPQIMSKPGTGLLEVFVIAKNGASYSRTYDPNAGYWGAWQDQGGPTW